MVLEEPNLGHFQLAVEQLSPWVGVGLGQFWLVLKLLLEAAAAWVESSQTRGCRHIAFEVVIGVAQQNMAAFEL